MSKTAINLSGSRFDRLLVIKDNGGRTVLCLCDCGVEKTVWRSNIKRKNNHRTRSCGCLKREGKFRTLPNGESLVNCLFLEYKKSANKRKLLFSLTKEEFWSFLDKNCFYCGNLPSRVRKRKGGNGSLIYNGIDRKDNKIGYLYQNCITCCRDCNYAKQGLTMKEFMDLIERIYSHQNLRPKLKNI